MKSESFVRMPLVALMMAVVSCAVLPSCRTAEANNPVPPDQQARLEAMRAMGTKAPITVFPVALSIANENDKGVEDIGKEMGKVLGVLLEQAGMESLEPTDSVFVLPSDVDFDEAAGAFGEFVRANPIETDYALYAEVVGRKGDAPQFDEIRSVVVDKAGNCLWVDRQTPRDADFKRIKPSCLMTACVLLSERVRKQLGIPKSAGNESADGKFTRMAAQDSPAPDEAEWNAMEKRQAIMKKATPSVKVAIFPVRLSDEKVGKDDSAHLAQLLNKKKLCAAEVVDSSLRVKIEPSHNEQKMLWDLARAFQDHVRQNPPEADYALLADYMISPRDGRVMAVHFVVCDRDGEWVIVDFQNDHHVDFQSVDPKTHEDCGRLVAKRLRGYLR